MSAFFVWDLPPKKMVYGQNIIGLMSVKKNIVCV